MRSMRKMHIGELYLPNDDEIIQDQIKSWIDFMISI